MSNLADFRLRSVDHGEHLVVDHAVKECQATIEFTDVDLGSVPVSRVVAAIFAHTCVVPA